MRQLARVVLVFTAIGCTVPVAGLATAASAAHRVGWQKAIEVPGTGRLNVGGAADLEAVSCASEGNCSAAGTYRLRSQATELYVVSERRGRWGRAQEMPGTSRLNRGGVSGSETAVAGMACFSPGNCTVSGDYTQSNGFGRPFVEGQRHGRWQKAKKLPGTSALNRHSAFTSVQTMSCTSDGNCAVGGSYLDRASLSSDRPFVADERNGVWAKAQKVPGIAALSPGSYGEVQSVSCWSAGNCVAGGDYQTTTKTLVYSNAFIVTEKDGTWEPAQQVPGITALNVHPVKGAAQVTSLSCPSEGNCTAVGTYLDTAYHEQVFVVAQQDGVWGDATEIPGTAALNTGGSDGVNQVSCASAGNCSAGGYYYTRGGVVVLAFVADEQNGAWGNAKPVPGLAALDTGKNAYVFVLSCGSPGNCSAGGSYALRPNINSPLEAFVVTERNGIWGKAREVPGTAALNKTGWAQVNAMFCGPRGRCVAGGWYSDRKQNLQAYVVSRG